MASAQPQGRTTQSSRRSTRALYVPIDKTLRDFASFLIRYPVITALSLRGASMGWHGLPISNDTHNLLALKLHPTRVTQETFIHRYLQTHTDTSTSWTYIYIYIHMLAHTHKHAHIQTYIVANIHTFAFTYRTMPHTHTGKTWWLHMVFNQSVLALWPGSIVPQPHKHSAWQRCPL